MATQAKFACRRGVARIDSMRLGSGRQVRRGWGGEIATRGEQVGSISARKGIIGMKESTSSDRL